MNAGKPGIWTSTIGNTSIEADCNRNIITVRSVNETKVYDYDREPTIEDLAEVMNAANL